MSNYDLHLHSIKSDGVHTPSEIAEMAYKAGLSAFALTDHDSVSGVREATKRAKELSITCVPGLEISARLNEEVHILGYNIDIDNADFINGLGEIQELRRQRNLQIIKKLHAHGIKLKVYEDIDWSTSGRSHIAKMLIEQGFVRHRAEAFDKYIGKKAPCYLKDVGISPEDAIKLINKAGGIAVLAHPFRFIRDGELSNFVSKMVGFGLGGIEAYYPNYGQGVRKSIKDVAKEYGLIVTGGSDYHSEEYGAGIGSVKVLLDKDTKRALKIEDEDKK